MGKEPQREESSVVIGRNPVWEALAGGSVDFEKVLIQKGAGGGPIDAIRRAATQAGVPVQYVPPARLARLSEGGNHQGVVALTARVGYLEVEEMLARIAPDLDAVRARKPVLLLLDGIEDPHNFGAILRSGVGLGAAGVVVPSRGMAPLNAAAIKASAGAALRIPIARVTNVADVIAQLKERGYWVAGAAGEGETSIWEMDWDRPLALVIGNEGRGLRRRVAEACDYLVSIPMAGPVESLNASVATGVLLAAAGKVRTGTREKGG